MKLTRGARAAPAVAMVVALAGCGGSDGIDSGRYVRDANRICADTQARAAAGRSGAAAVGERLTR